MNKSVGKKILRDTLNGIFWLTVYSLLEESGGYIPPKSSASTDITLLVATLLKINGAPLFDFYVDVDLYDHSRVSVFLDLPSRHLADSFFSNKYVSPILSHFF